MPERERVAHQAVGHDGEVSRRLSGRARDALPGLVDARVELGPALAGGRHVVGSEEIDLERVVRRAADVAEVAFVEPGIVLDRSARPPGDDARRDLLLSLQEARDEGALIAIEWAEPVRDWLKISAKATRLPLKPKVLMFAMLLPMTDKTFKFALIPLIPVYSDATDIVHLPV